jgi:CRISPR-associated protein Cmr6
MGLIYQRAYKRQPEVGGNAGAERAYCSWVSIKQTKQRDGYKEVVCLFTGGDNELRSQFLRDLAAISGAIHLFGVQP